MFNWFRKPTAADLIAEQIAEAERMSVIHHAAAEHHLALGKMFDERVKRLTPKPGKPVAVPSPTKMKAAA